MVWLHIYLFWAFCGSKSGVNFETLAVTLMLNIHTERRMNDVAAVGAQMLRDATNLRAHRLCKLCVISL